MIDFDALPEIVLPDGLPAWLIEDFAGTDENAYARVEMSAGHDRKRRMYRRPPIKRTVSMMLTEAETVRFESWFENDLQAGELRFSTRVRDMGPGHIWYAAQFEGPYQADYQHWAQGAGRAHWKITAELILYGGGSDFGPSRTPFNAAVDIALYGGAVGVRPTSFSSAIAIALQASSANVTLSAPTSIALDSSVSATGMVGLQASVAIELAAAATPTRTTLFKSNIEVALL